MLKKIIFFVLIATSFSFATSASAGWKSHPYISYAYHFKHNGDFLANWLGIPQFAQPTNYTCGSTTTSMQMVWETHKKGMAIMYDILSIHEYINSSGGTESGLNTEELKQGQTKVIEYINETEKLGLNVHMNEAKMDSIKDAISDLNFRIGQNLSPAIIFGNVDIPGASPGGHYYLVTGAIYCPKGTCRNDVMGLYINDSVYDSSAYNAQSLIRKQAISPREYVTAQELESYWEPTGSRWPWRRGHMYLWNSSHII